MLSLPPNTFSKKFIHMATDLKIDSSNPNAITYITEELGFTILGGIRMDGLDRLRVTILSLIHI